MLDPIDYVNEEAWPRQLREVVNALVERANAPWIIKYEDVPSPKVIQSDTQSVIVLPRTFARIGSTILPFTVKDHGAANSKVDITTSTLMGLTPTGLTALSVAANDDVYFALTVTRTDRIITSASVAAMAGTGIDYSTTDVDASGGTAIVNIKIGHIDSITSGVTKPSNIGHGPVGVVAEVNWNSLPGSEKVTFGIGINS